MRCEQCGMVSGHYWRVSTPLNRTLRTFCSSECIQKFLTLPTGARHYSKHGIES